MENTLSKEFVDFTFSKEYMDFIMPSTDVLREEERLSKLSFTERQLEVLRSEYLDGKITKDQYEDAIGCELFWALDGGKITQEEENDLYNRFKL